MILVCRCNYREDEKNEKTLVGYGYSPRLVPYLSSPLFRNNTWGPRLNGLFGLVDRRRFDVMSTCHTSLEEIFLVVKVSSADWFGKIASAWEKPFF